MMYAITKSLAITCLSALAIAGCASPPPGPAPLPPVSDRPASDQEVALALQALKDGAKDPDSVQVRDVKVAVHDKPGGSHMCGMFNAKNSYGGYVGFEPFWAYLSMASGALEARLFYMGSRDGRTWESCRGHGIYVR